MGRLAFNDARSLPEIGAKSDATSDSHCRKNKGGEAKPVREREGERGQINARGSSGTRFLGRPIAQRWLISEHEGIHARARPGKQLHINYAFIIRDL